MQGSTYSKADKDQLSIFLNKKLVTHDQFTDQWSSSALSTFTLNLKDKTVKIEDNLIADNGAFDFPSYNPLFNGKKENRFTYLFHIMGPKVVDDDYTWYLKKYDNKEKKVVKDWSPK